MGITCNLNAGNKVVMMDCSTRRDAAPGSRGKGDDARAGARHVRMELAHPNLGKYDISTLKIPIVSYQPCPSELISAFKKVVGIIPSMRTA